MDSSSVGHLQIFCQGAFLYRRRALSAETLNLGYMIPDSDIKIKRSRKNCSYTAVREILGPYSRVRRVFPLNRKICGD